MATLKLSAPLNMINAFLKLDRDKIMRNVFKSSTSLQQDILDLNREDQLFDKGIRSDGVSLGTYSESTINGTAGWKGKIALGLPTDHVTLYNEGKFYGTFKLVIGNSDIDIYANTIKPDRDLAEVYGEQIIGLTYQNKNVMIGWLKAPFVGQMRKAVFR